MQHHVSLPKIYENNADMLRGKGYSSPMDIANSNVNMLFRECADVLTFSETRKLHRAARRYVAKLKLQEARAVTRANPQLPNTVIVPATGSTTDWPSSLDDSDAPPFSDEVAPAPEESDAVTPAPDEVDIEHAGYEKRFGERANAYVAPDSVASLFSPAAYLTELYREGGKLHPADAPQHLDKRRPDLKNLALSQSNLDEEVTTLALSNEILTAACGGGVESKLKAACYPFVLPYDLSFARISAALEAHKTSFDALARNVSDDGANADLIAAFGNRINPALRQLLVDDIPTDSTPLQSLLVKHFGAGVTAAQLADIKYLCKRADISEDELNQCLTLPAFEQGGSTVSHPAINNKPMPPGDYGGQYLGHSTYSAASSGAGSGKVLVRHDGKLTQYAISNSAFSGTVVSGGVPDLCILPSPMEAHVMVSFAFLKGAKDLEFIIGTAGAGGSAQNTTLLHVADDPANSLPNRYFQVHVPVASEFTVTLRVSLQGSSHDVATTFTLTTPPPSSHVEALFVKISKLVRYCRATGLAVEDLDRLIRLSNSTSALTINANTFKLTARARQYMARYGVDVEDALVLAGCDINVCAPAGKSSQFDRLFNNPPLNKQPFEINKTGHDLVISCVPGPGTQSNGAHDRAVLKRAVGVDNADLCSLANLVAGNDSGSVARDLAGLSKLYRVHLFAVVHKLTVGRLALAFEVLGHKDQPLPSLPDDLPDFLDKVYDLTQWLDSQKLSVEALHAMTTTTYLSTMTPDIKRFVRVLYEAVGDAAKPPIKAGVPGPAGMGKDKSKGGESKEDILISAFAPHVTARFGLASVEMGVKLLEWMAAIAADRGLRLQSISDFANRVQGVVKSGSDNASDNADLAQFCQALGQLALIIKTWKLNTVDSDFMIGDATYANLKLLSGFKHWQAQLGERVSDGLEALAAGDLTPSLLAGLLRVSQTEVQTAWGYVATGSTGSDAQTLTSVSDGIAVGRWLQTARTMNLNVKTLHDLLGLTLADATNWQAVAADLPASASSSEKEAMNARLDQHLSTALCDLYMLNGHAPNWVNNRDDIYQYLLIDNQVSDEVKTARIASAVASAQLYINRCLQGVESEVLSGALNAKFFEDWDLYNRRYDTWAGVSKLVYYPENYLDPSLRYNQSHLMRELQQDINQNKLTRDSVDTAYHNYLSKFEEIANLKVLSGYHHSGNMDTGKIYFVARTNAAPYQYYWRQLDLDEADQGWIGVWAWNDWEKITCPVQPFNDEAYLVIFNDRLYVGWIEKTKKTDVQNGSGTSAQTKVTTYDYALKLSYRKINGSWSAPISFGIKEGVPGGNWLDSANLYLTTRTSTNVILVLVYELQSEVSDYKTSANLLGFQIDNAFQKKDILEQYIHDSYLVDFSNNLNTTSNPRKVVRYIADKYTFSYDHSTPYTPSHRVQVKEKISGKLEYSVIPPYLTVVADVTVQSKIPGPPSSSSSSFSFGQLKGTLKLGDNHWNGVVYDTEIKEKGVEQRVSLKLLGNVASGDFMAFVRSHATVFQMYYTFKATEDENAPRNPDHNYLIKKSSDGAEYLESTESHRRIRLNTLFANELIKRAKGGVGGVLSWKTQQLQEPQLGEGFYVRLTFNAPAKGHDPSFQIMLMDTAQNNPDSQAVLYAGSLNRADETRIHLFVPSPYASGELNGQITIAAKYGDANPTQTILFTMSNGNWALDTSHNGGIFDGLHAEVLSDHTEPMDFNGANGLYFWELFYYTPMLVAHRLVQEQNYEEAERWLKYIFKPGGYLDVNGQRERCWNVRPLQEDTTWRSASPDDVTDPDVVAMADPMHYKVSTFMKQLDMLIGRGDSAYRMLERDTLAEAKMDYVRALQLLGEEPDIPQASAWPDPLLADAVTQTDATRQLSGLFAPSKNNVLAGYWQTLGQRLYNLRHNLSIDGQALHLPLYATPVDPKKLQSAAASGDAGAGGAGVANISLHRFPMMLESARVLVSQLIQYGVTLSAILERKDAEALSVLMQTQAADLMETSIALQDKAIEQLTAEQTVLKTNRAGAQARLKSYQALLTEGVSANEKRSMQLRQDALASTLTANELRIVGGALDMVPNIFGLADGGSKWGAALTAAAGVADMVTAAFQTQAEGLQVAEQYRRRGQDWAIQRDNAKHEVAQLDAQKKTLAVQLKAAQLQKEYLQTEQSHTSAQLDFLKNKFSNEALYSWMHGRLSALFYQFYDLAVTRCKMAERGYQWETGSDKTFIQPGAWDSNHAGLLSGEALQLNLAKMESAYLEWDARALEVNRTVSMAQEMTKNKSDFNFKETVKSALNGGNDDAVSPNTPNTPNTSGHSLALDGNALSATINLNALHIADDYPSNLGAVRRIKQISVSLPALLGPYQDVQAVLHYAGTNTGIHQSCKQTAISHGIDDSGQFQLDFNDGKYLPFEGLPIGGDDSKSSLVLDFPNARHGGKQNQLVSSLNDIILHIRYTIRSK